jgi:hypothetical protein
MKGDDALPEADQDACKFEVMVGDVVDDKA